MRSGNLLTQRSQRAYTVSVLQNNLCPPQSVTSQQDIIGQSQHKHCVDCTFEWCSQTHYLLESPNSRRMMQKSFPALCDLVTNYPMRYFSKVPGVETRRSFQAEKRSWISASVHFVLVAVQQQFKGVVQYLTDIPEPVIFCFLCLTVKSADWAHCV